MQHNKHGELKLFRLFGHFKLLLVVVLSTAINITAEDSFSKFKRSQASSFTAYKDERDSHFNNYLKEHFKAYKVYKGEPLYEKPKPKKITSAIPTKIKAVGPKLTISIPEKILPKKELPKSVKKIRILKTKEAEIKVIEKVQKSQDFYIDFFGSRLGFDIPQNIKNATFYPRSQKGISNFFNSAASSEYESLVENIKKSSKDLNLNDWGVYLLVNSISKNIFSDADNSKLMSWFIFNKLGYAVKIGLANKHVVVMYYSKKIIYSTPSYNFSNKKYYVVSNYDKGNVGRLFSHKHDYPNATKDMDLSLESLPTFNPSMEFKTLSFKQYGIEYSVKYKYNKNLIDFMMTYPQADYETYFNTPLEDSTYNDLAVGLKKYIDGKKASDAMNFVLSFVQKSFEYKTDDEQFSREKPMFAQETLYFDNSDCEDRAVLFAYLVKKLFSVPVVGVKYKDHMSTALYIPMDGDKIIAKSREFVIADPTYINSNIGMNMPKYRSIKPEKYIVVKNK
ncbi:hypothetical protein N9A28_04240 [Sulfurimonas sp.]|nr:hypothetical protein [Sulfurimonas sp.]